LALTRRKFLGLLAIASAATIFSLSYPRLRQFKNDRIRIDHPEEATPLSESDTVNESAIDTIALFTGALFGRLLTSEQKQELIGRLTFAAQTDREWHDEYIWLANYVDNQVKELGAVSFAASNMSQRLAVANQVITFSTASRLSKLRALFSDEERYRRRMRFWTIDHLEHVYINSGVPWMIRGYPSWPGVPGDPRWYTQPGPDKQC
jgi:hypothetical protein